MQYDDDLATCSSQPCAILHSPRATTTSLSDVTSANSIGIFTKSYHIDLELAFRFSSFSGVDFNEFFEGKLTKSPSNTDLYRHNDFTELFRNSARMKIVIFDSDGNQDGFVEFATRKEAKKVSLLGMNATNSDDKISATGKQFEQVDFTFTFGSELNLQSSNDNPLNLENSLCNLRKGVLQINCQSTSKDFEFLLCNFQKWFQNDGHSLADKCAIFYQANEQRWSDQKYSVASRIEILLMPMHKVFSYPSQATMHVYNLFKDNDRSAMTSGAEQKKVFRSHDIERRIALSRHLRVDIVAKDGSVFQELVFEDGNDLESWFRKDKLVDTSSWSLSNAGMISVTEGYGRWFSVMNWGGTCFADIGWLLISCKNPCNWEQLNKYECDILYNPSSSSPIAANFFVSASKFEIFTDFYMSGYRFRWYKVFVMEPFSGVNIVKYFETGDRQPAVPGFSEIYPEKMYRHPDILDKLSSADKIRILVFDFEKENIVSEVVYSGPDAGDGFMEWFDWDHVFYSSLWDFSTRSVGHWGEMMKYNFANRRIFYMSSRWNSCPGDETFFAVISVPDATCGWEHWYNHDKYPHLGRNQPPVMFYSDEHVGVTQDDLKQAGKMVIEVQ